MSEIVNGVLWEDGQEAQLPARSLDAIYDETGDVYFCGDCQMYHLSDDFIARWGDDRVAAFAAIVERVDDMERS